MLESRHDPGARALGKAAVQSAGQHPAATQLLGHSVGPALGSDEDQRSARPTGDFCGHRRLVLRRDADQVMAHQGHTGLAGVDLVRDGLVQVVADQAVDGVVQGGGEQQSLTAVGHGVQYLTDRRQEAQVGHVIRLVEHRDLDAAQVGVPPVHQIDQPPGGRDNDVHTTGERQDLRGVRHAASDQDQRQPGDPGQGRHDVGDLHGQLPGRHQDKTAW